MSMLVRLYPRAWRDRYEAEFLALLEARPPTARDALDTVRGALDAHLHPNAVTGVEPQPWTHRLPGLLALSAGVMWLAIVLIEVLGSQPDGDAVWSLAGIVLVLMFLSLPGDYMAAHGRQIAIGFGLLGASFLGASVVPWPFLAIPVLFAYLIVLGGMLTMAAIRAGFGPHARWIILALVIGLPFILAVPIVVVALAGSSGAWAVAVFLPYGLAWTVVGLRMTLRGAPTIVDPPVETTEQEVVAA